MKRRAAEDAAAGAAERAVRTAARAGRAALAAAPRAARRATLAALAVAAAASLAAAAPAPAAPAPDAAPDSAQAAAGAPDHAVPVLLDRIVAIVDEEPVLQSDLDREIALYKLEREQAGQAADRSDEELRREILDRLVENKLLIAAAKEAEIRIEDETVQQDVEENVQELVKHFGSLAALEAELRRSGMTLPDYRSRSAAMLRDRHYVSAVINRFVRPKVEVLENELEEYYRAHPELAPTTPDSVSLASILIPVVPSDAAQRALQDKLAQIQQELAGGADFGEVARRHSEGPEARRGGLIGTLRPGDLASAQLERAIFALGAGETSRPVRAEAGLFIFHVDEVAEAGRTVRQIYLRLPIETADIEAARARAQAARERVLAGEPFDRVAAEVSADPQSGARGGDFGTFALDQLSPAIQEALRGRQRGEVTEPLQASGGFFVFLVKEMKPGRKLTYAEVKEDVRRAVQAQKLDAELTRYIDSLRTRFFVDRKG